MLVSNVAAKKIFRKNDRVIISIHGLRAGIWDNVKLPITGKVSSLRTEEAHTMIVRLDGEKRGHTYAWWFWERS